MTSCELCVRVCVWACMHTHACEFRRVLWSYSVCDAWNSVTCCCSRLVQSTAPGVWQPLSPGLCPAWDAISSEAWFCNEHFDDAELWHRTNLDALSTLPGLGEGRS